MNEPKPKPAPALPPRPQIKPLQSPPLTGRLQHFATEQDKQAYLDYNKQNAADLPF